VRVRFPRCLVWEAIGAFGFSDGRRLKGRAESE
jgi:hypothetical protein